MKGPAALFLAVVLAPQFACAAPNGYFDLTSDVTLATGDSWTDGAGHYRLYGVQSCLRGTVYTDKAEKERDCGEASLAVLAAYIKDTHPICAPVAKAAGITYVVCYATIAGKRLDLSTILITSGFAFAALDADGMPFLGAYAVAEQDARKNRAGLWQFEDVKHPSILLSRSASERLRKKAR